MFDLKHITFPYYSANIHDCYPKGIVSLSQFINSVKNPNDKLKRIYTLIAKAETENNMDVKRNLKKNYLYCFTPCVNLIPRGRRQYKDIKSFTGLMVLDFDHITNAVRLKQLLFNTFQFFVCVYLSPSKKGVKAVMRIPVPNSIQEFKEYFFGVVPFVNHYVGFDMTSINCVLPLFSSYDKDIMYRTDATVFDIKGVDPNPFIPIDTSNLVKVIPKEKETETVIKKFKSALSKIVDNGHPQLRSACRALGGYCIQGYISELEATNLIEYEVSTHHYFKGDVNNYLRTAKQFLKQGMRMPLSL